MSKWKASFYLKKKSSIWRNKYTGEITARPYRLRGRNAVRTAPRIRQREIITRRTVRLR